MELRLGAGFPSFQDLNEAVEKYSKENNVLYVVGDCRTVNTTNERLKRLSKTNPTLFNDKFKYWKGKCTTCKENEALYTCPACSINSCSLNCVKKHKVDKGCNGQRDKAAFVAIQEFNENHLLSDYRFLEEINRINQSAQRGIQDEIMPTVIGKRRQVQIIARRHKLIEYQMLPPEFERSKKNRTCMNKRTIMWTVELQFAQSGVMFFEHSVSENTTLAKILTSYLDPKSCDPIRRQRLKIYIQAGGMDKVKVLIQTKPFKEVEKRGFYVLDVNKSLADNLVGTYIMEYPTLIIILAEKLADYKIVENERRKEQDRNSRQQQRSNNRGPQKRHRGGRPDKDEQGEKKAKVEKDGGNKKKETTSDEKKDSLETQKKLKKSENDSDDHAKEKTVQGDVEKKGVSSEPSRVGEGSENSKKAAEKETKDLKQKDDAAPTKDKNNESTDNASPRISENASQDKKESDEKDD